MSILLAVNPADYRHGGGRTIYMAKSTEGSGMASTRPRTFKNIPVNYKECPPFCSDQEDQYYFNFRICPALIQMV